MVRLRWLQALIVGLVACPSPGCINLAPLDDVVAGDLGADTETANGDASDIDGPSSPSTFVKMVSGETFTLLLASDGVVIGWGGSPNGELLEVGQALLPRRLNVPKARDVAAGARHACVIDFDDTVHCWGDNADKQVTADIEINPALEPVQLDITAHAVFAGPTSTCITTLGERQLLCWGVHWAKVDPPRQPVGTNGLPTTIDSVADVSMGDGHLCVVTVGLVFCWGSSDYGALGDPAVEGPQDSPVRVYLPAPSRGRLGIMQDAVAVGGGLDHQCALAKLNPPSDVRGVRVACWGTNSFGQTGVDLPDEEVTLAKPGYPEVPALAADIAVAGGERHTCVLNDAGEIYCWGDNALKMVPNIDDKPAKVPSTPAAVPEAKLLSSARFAACAVTTTDEVWCWGSNIGGALGRADADEGAYDPAPLDLTGIAPTR